MEDSWNLLRECKIFLEKNAERWRKINREETARIREEEKLKTRRGT